MASSPPRVPQERVDQVDQAHGGARAAEDLGGQG